MRLSVHHDGTVIITSPFGVHQSVAEQFIRQKSEWISRQIARFKKLNVQPLPRNSRADYMKHKEVARAFVTERIGRYRGQNTFTVRGVSIRNQKTRWGSCSRKGNISFNYRIVFLPVRLAEYIVVHELCHLKQFNHSRAFWELVRSFVPEYKEIRRELQRYRLGVS
ncbi:MAG: SprT family zinc-dependent metalloprotease [Patescibacteria group bacterium]|jgi:hypothetical protein